jgi:catalase
MRTYRFEPKSVQTSSISERVAQLCNETEELAADAAAERGMSGQTPDQTGPGADGIRTRRVAILVTSGCDGESTLRIREALSAGGAVPRLVGITLGRASSINSPTLDIDVSVDAAASDAWDAMVIPNGEAAIEILLDSDKAHAFLKDQHRHHKPILLLGKAQSLLNVAGISQDDADDLLVYPSNDTTAAISAFIDKLATQRPSDRAQA